MLYIVLILVLAALGLLVTALITATSLWAWVSIGISVVAALVLIADWVRRRRARSRPAKSTATKVDASAVDEPDESEKDDADPSEDEKDAAERPVSGDLGAGTELLPAVDESEETQVSSASSGDPAEERTSPADVAIVSELDTEVLVVDEYPRYHVADCAWLAERETIPITVKEARDLGFTPCARCTPDAKLVAGTAKSRR